ncbi:MAG: aldehyde dehydrogenase family protein, partial [Solirubrobacterales bacterium]
MKVLENYIDGNWVPSSSGELHPVTDPATGEVLAEVPFSDRSDLDAAVTAAREALPVWRDVSTIARGRLMFELRQKLVARRTDLARSVTLEMGKT